jgi:hypothetical protein
MHLHFPPAEIHGRHARLQLAESYSVGVTKSLAPGPLPSALGSVGLTNASLRAPALHSQDQFWPLKTLVLQSANKCC